MCREVFVDIFMEGDRGSDEEVEAEGWLTEDWGFLFLSEYVFLQLAWL